MTKIVENLIFEKYDVMAITEIAKEYFPHYPVETVVEAVKSGKTGIHEYSGNIPFIKDLFKYRINARWYTGQYSNIIATPEIGDVKKMPESVGNFNYESVETLAKNNKIVDKWMLGGEYYGEVPTNYKVGSFGFYKMFVEIMTESGEDFDIVPKWCALSEYYLSLTLAPLNKDEKKKDDYHFMSSGFEDFDNWLNENTEFRGMEKIMLVMELIAMVKFTILEHIPEQIRNRVVDLMGNDPKQALSAAESLMKTDDYKYLLELDDEVLRFIDARDSFEHNVIVEEKEFGSRFDMIYSFLAMETKFFKVDKGLTYGDRVNGFDEEVMIKNNVKMAKSENGVYRYLIGDRMLLATIYWEYEKLKNVCRIKGLHGDHQRPYQYICVAEKGRFQLADNGYFGQVSDNMIKLDYICRFIPSTTKTTVLDNYVLKHFKSFANSTVPENVFKKSVYNRLTNEQIKKKEYEKKNQENKKKYHF